MLCRDADISAARFQGQGSWAAALLALLLAAPACAADRPPPPRPAQDTAIRYRQSFAGSTEEARMLFARNGLVRDEQPGAAGPSVTLLDRRRRLLVELDPAARRATVTPQTEDELRELLEGGSAAARFEAAEEEEIAGLPCRNWHAEEPDGTERDLCVTADGLPLRISDGTVQLEAVAVARGPLDAGLFRIPPGWSVVRADGGPVPPDLAR